MTNEEIHRMYLEAYSKESNRVTWKYLFDNNLHLRFFANYHIQHPSEFVNSIIKSNVSFKDFFLHRSLSNCFIWNDSEEGHDFWNEHCNNYIKILSERLQKLKKEFR